MNFSGNAESLQAKFKRHKISLNIFSTSALVGVAISAATIVIATISMSQPAEALPSFARQTGQPCGACHTDIPGLTPFGRSFKLGGYTMGGGKYRTTLFPSQRDSTKLPVSDGKGTSLPTKAPAAGTTNESDTWVPPISMMAIVGLTNTSAPRDPTGSPYQSNNNVVVAPVSFFYGGAITDHIGAFAQVTYNGAPFGAQDPANPYATFQWTWDNLDVRYANTGKLGDMDLIYGITANNNPTVQDLWNTTPAWSYPYAGSTVAPRPATGTLLEGRLAAHVGGVGAYAYINNMVYLELSGYRTIDSVTQPRLGANPFAAPGLIQGVAPYWRIAIEPKWGNHSLEIGAFGMSAQINPWTFNLDPSGMYDRSTYAQADRYTDTAFDAQYQYRGSNYWVTLGGRYIHEEQTLDASSVNLGTNATNTLSSLRTTASLSYGNDNRVVFTGQYFDTWGTSDPTLYANLASGISPNSNGYIAEIAYIPYITSSSPVWPWANARIALQYTYYNKFDGTTVNAHDNNTLFLHAWFSM